MSIEMFNYGETPTFFNEEDFKLTVQVDQEGWAIEKNLKVMVESGDENNASY